MDDENLPVPSGDNTLPTMGEALASWLGFRLPSIPMPQSARNLDKAVGTILLAAGENAVARIKSNTGKVKAKGKIDVEGLYRTDEGKRKIENKADIVQIAVDELNDGADSKNSDDAKADIDDDWLNFFSRVAEDKSSEELKGLFGRILAGEIRRPGAFSLRTLQFLSTLSKTDAHEVSNFLSFALANQFVPLFDKDTPGPHIHARIKMQELGLATHASMIGGLAWNVSVNAGDNFILTATTYGLLIVNGSNRLIAIQVECQVLTEPGQQLMKIANPKQTDFDYLKELARRVLEKIRGAGHAEEVVSGVVSVHAGIFEDVGGGRYNFKSLYRAPTPA